VFYIGLALLDWHGIVKIQNMAIGSTIHSTLPQLTRSTGFVSDPVVRDLPSVWRWGARNMLQDYVLWGNFMGSDTADLSVVTENSHFTLKMEALTFSETFLSHSHTMVIDGNAWRIDQWREVACRYCNLASFARVSDMLKVLVPLTMSFFLWWYFYLVA
jgi:hypothetical protein